MGKVLCEWGPSKQGFLIMLLFLFCILLYFPKVLSQVMTIILSKIWGAHLEMERHFAKEKIGL